jgi:hypothetical protein
MICNKHAGTRVSCPQYPTDAYHHLRRPIRHVGLCKNKRGWSSHLADALMQARRLLNPLTILMALYAERVMI